ARRHFELGAAYLQQSDYDNSLREFQAAYNLSKRPSLLLNIASVYERMGKLKEAVDTLTKYLNEDPKTAERATIETRIANWKKRTEPAPPEPAPTASASAAPLASMTAPRTSSAVGPGSHQTTGPVTLAASVSVSAAPTPQASNRTPAYIAL